MKTAEGHLAAEGSGAVYTIGSWHDAERKRNEDPAALSDRDIAIIGSFNGVESANQAWLARRDATAPATPPAPPADPPQRRRRSVAPARYSRDAATRYDGKQFEAALDRYNGDQPETLTDEDLAQLAVIDEALAGRAFAKRAGYLEPQDDVDADPLPVGLFVKWRRDVFGPILGTFRFRIRELVTRVEALEEARASSAPADVSAIERRLAALEQRPALVFRGVWDPSTDYAMGSLAVHGGSTWHADAPSRGVSPGSGTGHWTLMTKRGRDGRDGKDARS